MFLGFLDEVWEADTSSSEEEIEVTNVNYGEVEEDNAIVEEKGHELQRGVGYRDEKQVNPNDLLRIPVTIMNLLNYQLDCSCYSGASLGRRLSKLV